MESDTHDSSGIEPSISLDSIFNSPPRRAVQGRSRPTQRFGFESDAAGGEFRYAEGGNELTACLLLEHLWRSGYVVRYKLQPFDLGEIGGPTGVIPDILVQLSTGRVLVIEVKSAKFLTEQVRDRFSQHRSFLADLSIGHLLWTDTDPRNLTNVLNRRTWHSVRDVDRGRAFDLNSETLKKMKSCLEGGATTLRDFLGPNNFSWDELMAAIYQRVVHINVMEQLNEETQVFPYLPGKFYWYLFADRAPVGGWWDAL